jgi:methyl-accepting chemotaxis protein
VGLGIRQRLVILIFFGLTASLGLFEAWRHVSERQGLLAAERIHGERLGRLMAELAAPALSASDVNGLRVLAQDFLHTTDVQDVTFRDREGRELAHFAGKTPLGEQIRLAPLPVAAEAVRLGEIQISLRSADEGDRLRAQIVSAVFEAVCVFAVLSGLLLFYVTGTVTSPLAAMQSALYDLIDRKAFSRRLAETGREEIGALAAGVNQLLARIEQGVKRTEAMTAHIGELRTSTAADAREVMEAAETQVGAVASISTSVAEMSSSIQAVSESAKSLSLSAEETSSAILEMNASNQEVARHTTDLTASVEDVTTSVAAMIASIREVAGHVDSLSSAAEETAASAVEIEATVHEVEAAAKESTKLSQQTSLEAKDIATRTIHETIAAINAIKDTVERYSGVVTQLGKRSAEIGTILGIIVEVTERTNLLALNASILAAQAGEHGKGFAVVAEEIKALAERTAGSAQDIRKLITSVQKEVKEAVSALSDSLTAVEEGVRRSQEAGTALDKMLVSSTRSAEMAMMIDRAMTEQARGIRQVSEAVNNVKQMTVQIADATQTQSKGTERILHAAEEMRDISRQVKRAMNEQGRGGKQIAEAAENVTAQAGSIAAVAQGQQEAVRQVGLAIERVRDLPMRNAERIEGAAADAFKSLEDQALLLSRALDTVAVRNDGRDAQGG